MNAGNSVNSCGLRLVITDICIFEKIDRSLLEASRDLGDGPFHQFFKNSALSVPGVVELH